MKVKLTSERIKEEIIAALENKKKKYAMMSEYEWIAIIKDILAK